MIGFGHSASAAELVVDEIAREARSGRYALAPTPTANRRLVSGRLGSTVCGICCIFWTTKL